MASPSFEVEDQIDEDFFDKLVNDETDCAESTSGAIIKNNEFDVTDAFANLSISEVGSAGVDSSYNVRFGLGKDIATIQQLTSPSLDAHVHPVVAKESDSSIAAGYNNESTEVGMKVEQHALDNSSDVKSCVPLGTEMKEVQWDLFNSNSQLRACGSYSEFFTELGDDPQDPFTNDGNKDKSGAQSNVIASLLEHSPADTASSHFEQHQGDQVYGIAESQLKNGQDLNSSQYWENLYPGWKYDPNSGQWYQLENYDVDANKNNHVNIGSNYHENFNSSLESTVNGNVWDHRADAHYFQHTALSVTGNVAHGNRTSSDSNCNEDSPGSTKYPAHMVFDPQYPGWYFDRLSQKWEPLDSYHSAVYLSNDANQNLEYQNMGQNYWSQGLVSQEFTAKWGGSVHSYDQHDARMWQAQQLVLNETIGHNESEQLGHQDILTDFKSNSKHQQIGFNSSPSFSCDKQGSEGFEGSTEFAGFQNFNATGNLPHYHNHSKEKHNQITHFSPAHFDSQKQLYFPEQVLQTGAHVSCTASKERSSVRPPHALVTFGFGGKLVVMKYNRSIDTKSIHESKGSCLIIVHNLLEVCEDKNDDSSCDYFHVLCKQSFPGPLIGGNVGTRELNKWVDDRIANCLTFNLDMRKRNLLRLLLFLLKVALQFYGILRSPFGTGQAQKECDGPESAFAQLIASSKEHKAYGVVTHCLEHVPSEAQMQVTALEVQKLLVSGRIKEALEYAQEGQLWGPALVLASQLGDQFYGDTVKKMALMHLMAGSPLRTLCLLIAGQPADVFFRNTTTSSNLPGFAAVSQQPIETNCMLDEWEDNLSIITTNRTKDDVLVIVHLGDCLLKERGEVTAAHICYLVAEASFEPYSDCTRLCLIGADHWKYPRTYASPQAIQMTELYEYSKVLGNSHFFLLPFQPYKLIYAHMLAEVGKVSDALKYSQAILRFLKTRQAPEVDTLKQLVSSLEERIRTHQQGGYSTYTAPKKLVGKMLTFFDGTAHNVGGGVPPRAPSTSEGGKQFNERTCQPGSMTFTNYQSTMGMSSLMPSASLEPVSDGLSNQMETHDRSSRKVHSLKEANSSSNQEKASASTGSSRFGWLGSQLFQKTLGLVVRSRTHKQVKLGEKNKFYYDEKLKRWVEEGVEPPAEEVALPPPPTSAFLNGIEDHNIKDAPRTERLDTVSGPDIKTVGLEKSLSIPPIPPSSNQFSARGHTGVKSRYVDTFNKGGRTTPILFQSPSNPAVKAGACSIPKLFIPTPLTSSERIQTTGDSTQEAAVTNNGSPSPLKEDTVLCSQTAKLTPTALTMQRYPSMDDIKTRSGGMREGNNSLPQIHRAASWSDSLSHAGNHIKKRDELKPL